jgi:hypothetical protein
LTGVELHIADASGRVLERYSAHVDGSSVSVTVPGGLEEGIYWVRLYSGPEENELLREYALRIL